MFAAIAERMHDINRDNSQWYTKTQFYVFLFIPFLIRAYAGSRRIMETRVMKTKLQFMHRFCVNILTYRTIFTTVVKYFMCTHNKEIDISASYIICWKIQNVFFASFNIMFTYGKHSVSMEFPLYNFCTPKEHRPLFLIRLCCFFLLFIQQFLVLRMYYGKIDTTLLKRNR